MADLSPTTSTRPRNHRRYRPFHGADRRLAARWEGVRSRPTTTDPPAIGTEMAKRSKAASRRPSWSTGRVCTPMEAAELAKKTAKTKMDATVGGDAAVSTPTRRTRWSGAP